MNKGKGFTLAEVLSVLIILGVVAAITIPSTMQKVSLRASKTRLSKAMATYEKVMEKIQVEQNLRSMPEIKRWAESNNCANLANYFKINDGNGCIFRSSDSTWWDFTNIERPLVMVNRPRNNNIDENNLLAENNQTAFYLYSTFDTNGSLRVNDLSYLEKSEDYLNYAYLKKAYEFAFNKEYGSLNVSVIANNSDLQNIGIAPGAAQIIVIDGADRKYTYKITNTSGQNSSVKITKGGGTTYIKADKIKIEEDNGKDDIYIEGSDIDLNIGAGKKKIYVNACSGYVNINGDPQSESETNMNDITIRCHNPML